MRNEELSTRLNVRARESKEFLKCLHDADILPAPNFGSVKAGRTGPWLRDMNDIDLKLRTSMVHECDDPELRKLESEQIRQTIHGSVSI